MAIQLTTGKYKAPALQTPGVGAFSFQPTSYGPGGPSQLPKSPYGPKPTVGTGMYGPGPGGGGATAEAQTAGLPVPSITLPQGIAGTPAYTPDYGSMIGGSWEVGAAESAMASQMAAARAAFQQQLRQNFIDLGYSGDLKEGGLGDFSKYIDKDTMQKAIDNKFSAYSQVAKQQDQASRVNAALALSQGSVGGGAATVEQESLQSQVEQARYDSLRSFLSGGQQGLSNLTSMKASLAAGVAQARAAAASRLASMYPPTPAQPAQEPDWGDFWGSYAGGTWMLPQANGAIVQSGIPNAQGGAQPWYVPSGGGSWGNMDWLNPHV